MNTVQKDSLVLLTAFGSADLVLELIDFFNGGDQYRYNEQGEEIRRSFGGRRIGGLYLVCTSGKKDAFDELRSKIEQEYPELAGRIHAIDLSCEDITCQGDDKEARQLLYKAVREELAGPNLVISSGGRKALTQRLIEAGLLYGCAGYLAITAPEGKDKNQNIRSRTEEFNIVWMTSRQFAWERRTQIIREEIGDTFRSVYLFPEMVLKKLEEEKIGTHPAMKFNDLKWLQRLPKADLHCHLGGCQDEALLKKLAATLLDDLKIKNSKKEDIKRKLEAVLGLPLADVSSKALRSLDRGNVIHCLKRLPLLAERAGLDRHLATAVLVGHLTPQSLRLLCRDGRLTLDGKCSWPDEGSLCCGNRLDWYMACGDLGGSTLLQSENTLRMALRNLMEQAHGENVRYLEVRVSPENYTRLGLLTSRRALEVLLDEAALFMDDHKGFHANFLVMATRHKSRASMMGHVALTVNFFAEPGRKGPRVTGFDLAGQEKDFDPVSFKEDFLPLHRHFVNITIHAGEMAEDDKIWQAIYLLHAKRIGHGLKLIDNSKMMDFVRDHGLGLEMCPSSNMQTNTFRDFWDTSVSDGKEYPLKHYLEHGIRVTVNTDNRFISQTTASNEYLTAARLTRGGLSRWQVIKLIKNGFKSVFLPKDERDQLLKKVDKEIFGLLLDEYLPEGFQKEMT